MRGRIIGIVAGLAACGGDGTAGSAVDSSGAPEDPATTATAPMTSTGTPGTTAPGSSTSDGSSTSAAAGSTSTTTGGPPEIPEIDCGEPLFAEDSGLRRYPYLQSVSGTSARVAWTTTNDGAGSVRVAPSIDGPWTEVTAASTLFEMAYTTDSVDYWAYDSTLTDLEPNAAYCYEVVEDGATLASGVGFTTAWDDANRPVRILAFGDSGNFSPEQLGLRDQMLGRSFDVFLHLGDMAYGDGTFPEFEERVFLAYRDLLHRVPTYPAPGNHEYGTPGAQPYLDVYYLWEQALRRGRSRAVLQLRLR